MVRNRIRRLGPAAAVLILGFIGGPGSRPAADTPAPRNLLLITIDTWRADRLGAIQPERNLTPHLDRLAENGACFTRAFAHTPTTLPSHVNILTGTTPPYHGVHDNFNFRVREGLPLLSAHLRKHGFATGAFIGAYPLDSRFGLDRGFDVYDDEYQRRHDQLFNSPERPAVEVAEPASAWIRERSGPWFAWVHCYNPHAPYQPPEPFRSLHAEAYDGEVAYVDAVLGRMLERLESEGRMGRTLVVVTGDHGESLGEHGEKTHAFFAYNSTLWVPLLIAGPGISPSRIDEYVGHIDLFPTICELLKLPAPEALQGRSLKPLLSKKKADSPRLYFESLYPYYSRGWAPIRGFISNSSKFIDTPIPEFYRLDEDFQEKRNVITSPGFAADRRRLEDLIKDLSDAGASDARQAFDRRSLEKLSSLGYLSGAAGDTRKTFTRNDDVKLLLPAYEESEAAWAAYRSGSEAEGMRRLEAVIRETPNLDMAYKRLAGIHGERRRYDRALAVLEAGRQAVPASYEIFVDYIKTLNNAGRFGDAIREIENTAFSPVETDPEIWYNLGLARSRKGELEAAEKALEQGKALDDRYPELMNLLAEVVFHQSLKARDSVRLAKAEELFKKTIELDPGFARPYDGLGQVFRARGRLDEAIQLWETAQEKQPDQAGSLFNLGVGLLERGDKTNALRRLERYKRLYYDQLSPRLKENLDALIRRCRK